MALLLICYVDSKFQLSRFYRLLVMSKSILICQNLRTKTMVPYELTQSPNYHVDSKFNRIAKNFLKT